MLKLSKKYWWVIAILVVLLFLLLVTNPTDSKDTDTKDGCKKIDFETWMGKKQYYYNNNGNDWAIAHKQVVAEGYCPHNG